ncbi:MAG TPA: hypothetical protein VJV79_34455 [Polyangiaceae bacterium]|nr:hypothetical protein [Polyangiaceae bacterium]
MTPEVEPKPVSYGLEISTTADEIMIGLDFNLPERRLTARRPRPRGEYSIEVTDASGKTLERCKGGLVFENAIHDLSHVRAKYALEPKLGARVFANHANRVAEFTVVNNTHVDGVTYRGVVTDGAPRSVTVVKYDRYFYDTLLSVELFDKLALGCSALSRDD